MYRGGRTWWGRGLQAVLLLLLGVIAVMRTADAAPPPGRLGVDMLVAEAPPLTSADPDHPGMIMEMVKEAARRAQMEIHAHFIPWRRAQDMVSAGQNLLIAPVTRLPFREGRYRWIAPLHRQDWVLATLDHQVNSLEQARREGRKIIVGAGSAQERMLRDALYPEELILTARLGDKEIDLLLAGRGNAWFNSLQETTWRWGQATRKEKLQIGAVLGSNDSYLACSIQCDEDLVAGLRRAFFSMRSDGALDKLAAKYGYGS